MPLLFSTEDFDAQALPFSVRGKRWVSIEQNNSLYRLLPSYIIANAVEDPPALKVKVLSSSKNAARETGLVFGRVALEMGKGVCKFRSFDGEVFDALCVDIGKPVGGGCGVEQLKSIVVFTDGPIERLAEFLSALVQQSEKSEEGRFICHSWHIEHGYWREETKIKSRPLQSVVLPRALKDRLVNDLEKFLSPRTQDFYNRNGIPYRRSFLFYGVPGTGKTSLVQALAGHFRRSVSFLLPTHPKMTDDSLREAINQIPDDTIVVFEDIDSLFTADRENRVKSSCLTFSGLLNALDGISNPNGQIFILTTNLRDNLDHALLRNGRVDMHVEFSYAVGEQMELMWSNFYPSASHLAAAFSEGVRQRLQANNLQLTTSALQHFFVTQMDASAEEALQRLDSIVEDIIQNSSKAMLTAATVSRKGKGKTSSKPKAAVQGQGAAGGSSGKPEPVASGQEPIMVDPARPEQGTMPTLVEKKAVRNAARREKGRLRRGEAAATRDAGVVEVSSASAEEQPARGV